MADETEEKENSTIDEVTTFVKNACETAEEAAERLKAQIEAVKQQIEAIKKQLEEKVAETQEKITKAASGALASMTGLSMPDAEAIVAKIEEAMSAPDKVKEQVKQMAQLMVEEIQKTIQKSLSKKPPEMPTLDSLKQAVQTAIDKSAPTE